MLNTILGHQQSDLELKAELGICLLGKKSEAEAWLRTIGQAGNGVCILDSS